MSNSLSELFENEDFQRCTLSEGISNPDVLKSLSFSEQILYLTTGLDKISIELQSQVRKQHGALLSQASHAGNLSTALDVVCGHMERLKSGADRLKNQLNGPFELVKNQTVVLERLHTASHLLRQTGRFLQLSRQLQSTKDAKQQALILNEMDSLFDDISLSQINFIRDERVQVLAIKQRLLSVTNNELLLGLKSSNELSVSNCLQIFANLQSLQKCINNIIDTFIAEARQSLNECFSGTSSSKSHTPTDRRDTRRGPGKNISLTTSQNFRSKLWIATELLFEEEIHSQCVQIIFLQHCIHNVQLPSLDSSSDLFNIEERYWKQLEELFRHSFDQCAIHVRQCLQQDLPKLLSFAKKLKAKIGTTFEFSENVFGILKTGYLELCAVNLKSSLAGTDCPNQEAVDTLLRAASVQLSAAIVDVSLSTLVAHTLTACNADFWSKIEANIKLGTDSMQVIDVPNFSQNRNTHLANMLHYHAEHTKRMIQNLGPNFANSAVAEIILKDLNKGHYLTIAIVQQLFDSMTTAVKTILISMHREPGLNNTKPSPHQTTNSPSLYMKELHEFLNRSWNLHIVVFNDRKVIDDCGKTLVEKCIDLFVKNASIIRPISDIGRRKLKTDCQFLETALKTIIDDISTFGRPYRQLRALSTLITLSAEELSQQSAEHDGSLSPVIILFLMFGHAGNDLSSPHTAIGWSNEKLLDWLDGHTSNLDRLELVNGSLLKYRSLVRQRNSTQYDPVYPLIANYLEMVTATITVSK